MGIKHALIPLNCDWSFESNMVILRVAIFNHEQQNILCLPSTSGQWMAKETYKQLAMQNQNTPPLQGSRALAQAIVHLLTRIQNHKLLQPKLNTSHSYSRKSCPIIQTYRPTNTAPCVANFKLMLTSFLLVLLPVHAVWFSANPPFRADVLPCWGSRSTITI
jgi:hypothetical protein